MNTRLIAVAALLASIAPATAGRVDITRPASPGVHVEIEIVAGTLAVKGWDKPEVQVTGTTGEGVREVAVAGDEEHVEIAVELVEGRHHRSGSADLVVYVPRRAQLDIEAVSVPVDVSGVAGSVAVECVSGNVTVAGSASRIEIETVSGAIRVGGTEPVEVAELESVSGTITFEAPLAPRGRLDMETVSGNLTVALGGRGARVDASTFSGNIVNDFGQKPVRESGYVPAQELRFTQGDGGAEISLESFSGTITIKKM